MQRLPEIADFARSSSAIPEGCTRRLQLFYWAVFATTLSHQAYTYGLGVMTPISGGRSMMIRPASTGGDDSNLGNTETVHSLDRNQRDGNLANHTLIK